MVTDLALVAVTGYAAQAACAVVVALVLVSFHRHYHRSYLRDWASAWWAFAVFLAGAALAHLLIAPVGSPASWLRVAVTLVSLLGGYCQVGWLLLGTHE